MKKNLVIDKIGYDELKAFHTANRSHKLYTYCVVASEKKVTEETLAKYNEVKKLTLEEIFEY